jgi:hypothetical protein
MKSRILTNGGKLGASLVLYQGAMASRLMGIEAFRSAWYDPAPAG